MSTRTVTIDTNEWNYMGEGNTFPHAITNGQTFTISVSGSGTPRRYTIVSVGPITRDNAMPIQFDNELTSWQCSANGTATLNAGSWWIEEGPGHKVEWKIRSATMDNVATPTAMTIVAERADNRMVTFTLNAVTVGA